MVSYRCIPFRTGMGITRRMTFALVLISTAALVPAMLRAQSPLSATGNSQTDLTGAGQPSMADLPELTGDPTGGFGGARMKGGRDGFGAVGPVQQAGDSRGEGWRSGPGGQTGGYGGAAYTRLSVWNRLLLDAYLMGANAARSGGMSGHGMDLSSFMQEGSRLSQDLAQGHDGALGSALGLMPKLEQVERGGLNFSQSSPMGQFRFTYRDFPGMGGGAGVGLGSAQASYSSGLKHDLMHFSATAGLGESMRNGGFGAGVSGTSSFGSSSFGSDASSFGAGNGAFGAGIGSGPGGMSSMSGTGHGAFGGMSGAQGKAVWVEDKVAQVNRVAESIRVEELGLRFRSS
jgi:hypothetical protein